MTKTFHHTLIALSCVIALSACGSDDDQDEPVNEPAGTSPDPTAPGTVTAPEPQGAPVGTPAEPTSTEELPVRPVGGSNGGSTTDGTDEGTDADPVGGAGDVDPGTLSLLYGEAAIGYRFVPDGTSLFLLNFDFGADDLFQTDDGTTVIQTNAVSAFVPDGEEQSEPVARPFGCIEINGGYVCIEFYPDDALGYFVFGTPQDGEAPGVWQFCEPTRDRESCLDQLVDSADGEMIYSRRPANAAATIDASATSAGAVDGSMPYVRYDAQASSASNGAGAADLVDAAQIAKASAQLLELLDK